MRIEAMAVLTVDITAQTEHWHTKGQSTNVYTNTYMVKGEISKYNQE